MGYTAENLDVAQWYSSMIRASGVDLREAPGSIPGWALFYGSGRQ